MLLWLILNRNSYKRILGQHILCSKIKEIHDLYEKRIDELKKDSQKKEEFKANEGTTVPFFDMEVINDFVRKYKK